MASEGGSSWGPGSLLLREDESSSSPAVEGADSGKAPGMESNTVWEADVCVCGERVLKPAPRRVPSADREVDSHEVGKGFEVGRSLMGRERALGGVGISSYVGRNKRREINQTYAKS